MYIKENIIYYKNFLPPLMLVGRIEVLKKPDATLPFLLPCHTVSPTLVPLPDILLRISPPPLVIGIPFGITLKEMKTELVSLPVIMMA